MCLEGEAEFQTDVEKMIVRKGMVYYIRSDEKHGVKPLGEGGVVFLDVFSPPREEYLPKDSLAP